MARNQSKKLSSFDSLGELVEFFDTNDLGDYWANLREAHFDVEMKKRAHLIALDEDLVEELSEIARLTETPSQKLVNTWLKEKIAENS